MGTQYYAIVEQQENESSKWVFVSFWDLGKCYELSAEVHRLNPTRGVYCEWPYELGALRSVLGEDRYYKTTLAAQELPLLLAFGNESFTSLVDSTRKLSGNVRMLFCQDQ